FIRASPRVVYIEDAVAECRMLIMRARLRNERSCATSIQRCSLGRPAMGGFCVAVLRSFILPAWSIRVASRTLSRTLVSCDKSLALSADLTTSDLHRRGRKEKAEAPF